jgi:hypothetical protein
LCRCGILQPGIDKFRESVFFEPVFGDQQIVAEAGERPIQPDGDELALQGLMCQFLLVGTGDIPGCECLPFKELPCKFRFQDDGRPNGFGSFEKNEFVESGPDVFVVPLSDIDFVIGRFDDKII